MYRYLIKRILLIIPILLGVSLITFTLIFFTPGDPAEQVLREQRGTEEVSPAAVERLRGDMGLDRPVHQQYFDWIKGLIQGDMGESLVTGEQVSSEIARVFPYTMQLSLASIAVALIIAVPVGVLSAVKHNSIVDFLSMAAALVGVSMPNFWLALLLMLFFSLHLGLLPVSGFGGGIETLILPAITLGTGMAAMTTRLIRSSMLEVMEQEYTEFARAKGLSSWKIIHRHTFKNAMIPVITYLGLQLGWALEGAVIVESIFARPGIGSLLYEAVQSRDFPLIQGCVLYITLVFVLANLLIDMIYVFIDPRIKYSEREA